MKKKVAMELTTRIRWMKRGRQAWRQWLSKEQADLKSPALIGEKKRKNNKSILLEPFVQFTSYLRPQAEPGKGLNFFQKFF